MRSIIFVLSFLILPFGGLNAQKSLLKGSPRSMVKQNKVADKENLTRIKNERAIRMFASKGLLVPLVDGHGIVVDHRLDANRRYCRPWAVKFLKDLGTRFEKNFRKPIRVNSCVRDIETQEHLRWLNPNAAKTKGPKASAHLTGSAIDIARIGLSKKEQEFIRTRLIVNEKAGKIEATEEVVQKVWHVMVFKTYASK